MNDAVSSPRSPKTVDAKCMAPELAAASCFWGDGRGAIGDGRGAEPHGDLGGGGVVGAALDPGELEEELDSDASLEEELSLELERLAECLSSAFEIFSTT